MSGDLTACVHKPSVSDRHARQCVCVLCKGSCPTFFSCLASVQFFPGGICRLTYIWSLPYVALPAGVRPCCRRLAALLRLRDCTVVLGAGAAARERAGHAARARPGEALVMACVQGLLALAASRGLCRGPCGINIFHPVHDRLMTNSRKPSACAP